MKLFNWSTTGSFFFDSNLSYSNNVGIVKVTSCSDTIACMADKDAVICKKLQVSGNGNLQWFDVKLSPDTYKNYKDRTFVFNKAISGETCNSLCQRCFTPDYGTPWDANGIGCYGKTLSTFQDFVFVSGVSSTSRDFIDIYKVAGSPPDSWQYNWIKTMETSDSIDSIMFYNKYLVVGMSRSSMQDIPTDGIIRAGSVKVHVFTSTDAVGNENPTTLIANRVAGTSQFGRTVSIGQELIVVSAPGNATLPGSVLVYRLSAATSTALDALCVIKQFYPTQSFGNSLSLFKVSNLNYVAIGDPLDNIVYLVEVSPSVPNPCSLKRRLYFDPTKNNGFGTALALNKNFLVVGYPNYDNKDPILRNGCPAGSCPGGLFIQALCLDSSVIDCPPSGECKLQRKECSDVMSACYFPATCQHNSGASNPTCADLKSQDSSKCNDGNSNSGDGCSASCTEENGFVCHDQTPQISQCSFDEQKYSNMYSLTGNMSVKRDISKDENAQQSLKTQLVKIVANSITEDQVYFQSVTSASFIETFIKFGIVARIGGEGAGYSMFRNMVDEMDRANGIAVQANIIRLYVQLNSPSGQVLSSYSFPVPTKSVSGGDPAVGPTDGSSWLSKNKSIIIASIVCPSALLALLLLCRFRKCCAKSSIRIPTPEFGSGFTGIQSHNVSSHIAIEMPARQPAPMETFARPAPSPGLTKPDAPLLKGSKVPTYVKYKKHFAAKASRARHREELAEEEEDVEQQSVTSSVDEKECMICLGTFRPGDRVRMLPCMHCFHKPCVDEWLEQGHDSCPLCMQSVSDQPAEISSEYRRNVEKKLGISSMTQSRRNERRGGRRLLRELIEEEQDRSQDGEISESESQPSRAAGGPPASSRYNPDHRGGRGGPSRR